jgi:hypothetical protein
MRAAARFPEIKIELAEATWDSRIRGGEITKEKRLQKRVVGELANVDAEEFIRLAQETESMFFRERADRLERKKEIREAVEKVTIREKAQAKLIEAQTRKQEAKAKAAEARREAAELLKKERLLVMAKKEEHQAARRPANVVVQDSDTPDVVRDITWVYQNLNQLIGYSENGIAFLDQDLLAKAPSNGAVNFAEYAKEDRKGFFEKFVMKLLPKDQKQAEAESEEEAAARLDPGLKDLEKYWGKSGG